MASNKVVLVNKLVHDNYLNLVEDEENGGFNLFVTTQIFNAKPCDERDADLILAANNYKDQYIKVPLEKYINELQEIVSMKALELDGMNEILKELRSS